MRKEGYSTWFVCVSTLTLALHATRPPISNTGSFRAWNITAIFLKRLCLRDMPWKQAKKPICIIACFLDLFRSLCLEAQQVTTNGVYQLLHAIYYCNQTLRELLAWRPRVVHTLGQTHQLVVPHMRSVPMVCTFHLTRCLAISPLMRFVSRKSIHLSLM